MRRLIFSQVTTNWRAGCRRSASPVRREGQSSPLSLPLFKVTITYIYYVFGSMPQSLALVLVHIIFSTKNRIAFLQSNELRSAVHAYLTGTLRGLQCEPLQVGGMPDHVHILSGLSRTTSLAEMVKKLKTSSTTAVKAKGHPSGRKSRAQGRS